MIVASAIIFTRHAAYDWEFAGYVCEEPRNQGLVICCITDGLWKDDGAS
jgi:hypothetical protein